VCVCVCVCPSGWNGATFNKGVHGTVSVCACVFVRVLTNACFSLLNCISSYLKAFVSVPIFHDSLCMQ
jgi:hypothetical protein